MNKDLEKLIEDLHDPRVIPMMRDLIPHDLPRRERDSRMFAGKLQSILALTSRMSVKLQLSKPLFCVLEHIAAESDVDLGLSVAALITQGFVSFLPETTHAQEMLLSHLQAEFQPEKAVTH